MAEGSKPWILYVDDNPGLRDDFRAIFEALGYNVTCASSGEEAWDLLQHRAPVDAVVSDLTLGGMTGFDLLARIRQKTPSLPFILVSGHTAPQARERAAKLGSSAFFDKPYRSSELEAKLAKLIAQYRASGAP